MFTRLFLWDHGPYTYYCFSLALNINNDNALSFFPKVLYPIPIPTNIFSTNLNNEFLLRKHFTLIMTQTTAYFWSGNHLCARSVINWEYTKLQIVKVNLLYNVTGMGVVGGKKNEYERMHATGICCVLRPITWFNTQNNPAKQVMLSMFLID